MTPGDFLRSIWPAEGHYCIAWPFKLPSDPTKTVFAHKVFDDIKSAEQYVLANRASKDIYFAVLSLRERSVIDPNKIDPRTGQPGARAVRKQSNMLAAKAFFFDIDVDPANPEKYPTQYAAIMALRVFVADTNLPAPTIVSSGAGLHVYWILETSLKASKWQTHAGHLRQLAKHYGLLIDPSRTTDTASVLRVAGTFNHKQQPRPVAVLKQGSYTPTPDFIRLVSDALTRAGEIPRDPLKGPSLAGMLGSNIDREYDGPAVQLKDVGNACTQVRKLLKTRGNVTQSAWYHGILNVVKYTEMPGKTGRQLAHEFSQGHPQYSAVETDAKLDQLETSVNAPARCETIAEHSPWGDEPCQGCPFKNDATVPNPLVAARRTAKAPPPIVLVPIEGISTNITIPDPPRPFVRLKAGGIAKAAKNSDGDEVIEVIYPYDLYPIRRLVNIENVTEQHLWCVALPREGDKEFLLDADALYDSRKFVYAIAHQGVYPHKSHVTSLQEYMVAYISELQRLMDVDIQANHLGWSKEQTEFILPDKILSIDGSVKPVALGLGAQRASAHIFKKGTLQNQIALMNFYKNPLYIPHQYFVLQALASVVYHATGHHGIIVNASGDAGASKSTALSTGAAAWGHPTLYPINGTNSGATVRGRNERISVLANLPICVDEITHMPVREAQDLAMGVTQPGHRIRLQQDGVERASIDSYKSTIMMTTANNSLHTLLSTDNAAGNAGSMRLFEIQFRNPHVHTKNQADQFLRALNENFGHIGELVVAQYLKQKEAFNRRLHQINKEIDEAANIQSGERFWSADAAATLAVAELTLACGLMPYDPLALRGWLLGSQIPHMRATVSDEYSSPLTILTDYLEQINGNIIVTETATHLGRNLTSPLNRPSGALLGHYDRSDNLMFVLKKGFKDYCLRIGANPSRIINDLGAPAVDGPIIATKNARRTLGAGTDWAKSQSWCFVINMSHPAICGTVDLHAIGTDSRVTATGVRLRTV
jgi:hypothetical protein